MRQSPNKIDVTSLVQWLVLLILLAIASWWRLHDGPMAHSDTVRDLFMASECIGAEGCHLIGPPTSFAGFQGGFYLLHLAFWQSLGLSVFGIFTLTSISKVFACVLVGGLASLLWGRWAVLWTGLAAFILFFSNPNEAATLWNPSLVPLLSSGFFLSLALATLTRQQGFWFASAAMLSLLVQTHLVSMLLIPFLILVFYQFPPDRKIVTAILSALLFLLLFPLFSKDAILALLLMGDIGLKSGVASLQPWLFAVWMFALIALVAMVVKSRRFKNQRKQVQWIILVVGGGYLASVFGGFMLFHQPAETRYLSPVFPILALLPVALYDLLQRKIPAFKYRGWIEYALAAVFALAFLYFQHQQAAIPRPITFTQVKTVAEDLTEMGIDDYAEVFQRIRSPQWRGLLGGLQLFLPAKTKPESVTAEVKKPLLVFTEMKPSQDWDKLKTPSDWKVTRLSDENRLIVAPATSDFVVTGRQQFCEFDNETSWQDVSVKWNGKRDGYPRLNTSGPCRPEKTEWQSLRLRIKILTDDELFICPFGKEREIQLQSLSGLQGGPFDSGRSWYLEAGQNGKEGIVELRVKSKYVSSMGPVELLSWRQDKEALPTLLK